VLETLREAEELSAELSRRRSDGRVSTPSQQQEREREEEERKEQREEFEREMGELKAHLQRCQDVIDQQQQFIMVGY